MKDFSFEDAKQAVAEKCGVAKFYDLPLSVDHGYWAKAADLYAQQVANEAVKSDRDSTDGYYKEYMSEDLIIKWYDLQFRPLPFPEES